MRYCWPDNKQIYLQHTWYMSSRLDSIVYMILFICDRLGLILSAGEGKGQRFCERARWSICDHLIMVYFLSCFNIGVNCQTNSLISSIIWVRWKCHLANRQLISTDIDSKNNTNKNSFLQIKCSHRAIWLAICTIAFCISSQRFVCFCNICQTPSNNTHLTTRDLWCLSKLAQGKHHCTNYHIPLETWH